MASYDCFDEYRSVWRLMSGGTHAKIVSVLDVDPDVRARLAELKSKPDDAAARDKVIDALVRYTGNCVGQAALQELKKVSVAKLQFRPSQDGESIYRALPSGTEAVIAAAVGAKSEVHEALARGDSAQIVRLISRMAGRCIGQEILSQGWGVLQAAARIV